VFNSDIIMTIRGYHFEAKTFAVLPTSAKSTLHEKPSANDPDAASRAGTHGSDRPFKSLPSEKYAAEASSLSQPNSRMQSYCAIMP
jgi:hypothetical protein